MHTLLVLWLLRHGVQWLLGGGGAGGPRGGGGGGSAAAARYVQLPALSAPQQIAVPAPAPVSVPAPPIPEPLALEVPDVAIATPPLAAPAAMMGAETGGGPGTGPGTGGGVGAGTGTGAGNDSGSGRGGEREYISPPELHGMLLPPDCARGRFTVRFWVEADGRVSRVVVDPPPKDAGCRREMFERMMSYQFRPARTWDGRAVAFVYPVQVQH